MTKHISWTAGILWAATVLFLMFTAAGCSTVSHILQGSSDTIITETKNGEVVGTVKVTAKADSLVVIEKHENGEVKKVTVDDRGKPSAISEAIAAIIVMGANRTDVRIDGD